MSNGCDIPDLPFDLNHLWDRSSAFAGIFLMTARLPTAAHVAVSLATLWLSTLTLTVLTGCSASRPMIVSNPVFVPANVQHAAWERTVDTLHAFHFPIVRENRLDGVIETDYRVGSNILEPWHGDSVGAANRLESTLQSIRRKVKVDLTPVDGGFLVAVEAHKELEDLNGVAENTTGAATFREGAPLERNLKVVVGQSSPSGWTSLGRDTDLEQAILSELQR